MNFWGPTLGSGIAASIERAIGRALELDPVSQKALLGLFDEPFLLRIKPPGQDIYLTADQRAVRVQFECNLPPTLVIEGAPLAFAAAALGDESVFADGRLKLNGDVARAHRFQRILQQLGPDWEASLADVIGGVPAHLLAGRLRQGLRWSREVRRALSRNLEEYLQEESDTIPAKAEAEALFEDIDSLRLEVDRLEARLRHLEQIRAGQQGKAGDGEPGRVSRGRG